MRFSNFAPMLLGLLFLRSSGASSPAPKAPALPSGTPGGLRVFPVAASGRPSFGDAFGSHRGTDIFAPRGTPVLAVDDGHIRADTDPKGGQVTYLRCADGAVYYYAHLDQYVGTYPRAVTAGEVIGTVGTTGNAQGTTPHLHFEVHPRGDHDTINPFPLLQAAQRAGKQPDGLEVARVLTGGQPFGTWFGDRFALTLEVLRPNVPIDKLVDIALSIIAQWAHETARGAAEFNFNLGGWKARPGDRYFTAVDAQTGAELFRWTAYADLPNAVADQLQRLHDKFPSAWALLVGQPNTSAWVEELGRRGYYVPPKGRSLEQHIQAYARAWASNRAELGALAA
jgi:hypothetical protein